MWLFVIGLELRPRKLWALRDHGLVIGFGRFGQFAVQVPLARGAEVAVIESDPERLPEAGRLGFRVPFGDGTRLHILRAGGAEEAEVIRVCVDDRAAPDAIVGLVRHALPNAVVLGRSDDRGQFMALIRAGAGLELRETAEATLLTGAEGLRRLGAAEATVAEALEDIPRRNARSLVEQVQGEIVSGRDHLLTFPVPEPLTPRPPAA